MEEGRCQICENVHQCKVCGAEVASFKHIGVRSTALKASSIWHYAVPCGHRAEMEKTFVPSKGQGGQLAKYQGGPIWKEGYRWYNVFWGTYWNSSKWTDLLDKAVQDIETNSSYAGDLAQYNVGEGKLAGHVIIQKDPAATLSEKEIGTSLTSWITNSLVPDLGGKGAYNIFLPPGIKATLGTDSSCVQFCDYHDTVSGTTGPFFTLEPYPCSSGCNQCDGNDFDTLTQGLSEEMVELKTDMNPGTGWVIGNEEICDYCDKNFVCNKISTGEYVNSWYSDKTGACWVP